MILTRAHLAAGDPAVMNPPTSCMVSKDLYYDFP
jgi:hypothetical protein